jgi:hypothetical protein
MVFEYLAHGLGGATSLSYLRRAESLPYKNTLRAHSARKSASRVRYRRCWIAERVYAMRASSGLRRTWPTRAPWPVLDLHVWARRDGKHLRVPSLQC